MQDVEAYKTIKVPRWVYENAIQVQLALSRKGVGHLSEEVLKPQKCPICKSDMEAFHGKYEYLRCTHCGYTQQLFEPSGIGESTVLGTAIGMGLVYLLNALFRNGGPRGRSAATAE